MEEKKAEMEKRIKIIKDFAKKMNYKYLIQNYKHYKNKRPMKSIELLGTYDSEGEHYAWVWYTDTYDEYNEL